MRILPLRHGQAGRGTTRSLPALAIVLLAGWGVLSAAAREGGKDEPKEPPVAWPERFVPGQSVTLRLKRAPGRGLIYEGALERSQQSDASYNESAEFYLTVLCKQQDGALDQLAFRRTYLNRSRHEVLENGRKIDRILENTDDLVNLGPNFSIIDTLRCYAYDAQNRVAYRTEQLLILKDGRQLRGAVVAEDKDKLVFLTGDDKFDVARDKIETLGKIEQPLLCINDTPHYLFPLFSNKAVAPGETWRFKVPVIIPVEQGPVLLTQFNAGMIGRLREVRQSGGTQIAVVDYQVSGVFDSKAPEFRARFAEAFHEANQVVHRLSGSGTVTLDVEKGRILEKSETINATLYGSSMVQQGANKPAVQKEKRAEMVSKYRIRLLPPGTRLKNGKVIPEYDGKDER